MNAPARATDMVSSAFSLPIEGMTCASCVGRVERALKAVPGVTGASVNLATERATVEGSAEAEALIAAVERTGYEAKLIAAASKPLLRKRPCCNAKARP